VRREYGAAPSCQPVDGAAVHRADEDHRSLFAEG
jgi:hypothetical protein